MRNNFMVGLPPNPMTPDPFPSASATAGGPSVAFLSYSKDELGWMPSIMLSLAAHVGAVLLAFLIMFLMQLLGWSLLTFDRPERVKDIEFQLVTAPEATPRNPNTKNRAERNTRAGGEKIPNLHEAEAQRKAGDPKPQPQPKPQVAQKATKPRQQQRPQPPKQSSKPVPVTQNNQQQSKPAPPKPRVTAPKPSTNRHHIAAVPNPVAPIKVPDSGGPVADTGPVVRNSGGSSSGSTSGGSSSGAPATMPGQFSGSGSPSAGGGPQGQGGRGAYSQHGSPGGGGGRPGIDAVAEPDFGPYLAELQRRIRRNWSPPEDREDKTVVLLFTISKDGRLLSINTKRSSGYANADGAARAAVERSAPFRPLPPEYRNNSINVEFTFDYNVYTGRSGGISRR